MLGPRQNVTSIEAELRRLYSPVMIRTPLFIALLCGAGGCSSSSTNAGCPDLSGNWVIAAHCATSLIGEPVKVTANGCALSFGAPFDGFKGNVSADGAVTVTGAQSCSGVASASEIGMVCTPQSCMVKLSR